MKSVAKLLLVAILGTAGAAAHGQAGVRHVQNETSPIAVGVWAGDTFYLSGQIASPLDPKTEKPEYGDTEKQAHSIFMKIQALLQGQGLDMKDVVKMTVFLAGDPNKGGKLDFAGLQASYTKFFGTKDQPNKPARSAVQVAALAAPWALLEIEVIAVKSR